MENKKATLTFSLTKKPCGFQLRGNRQMPFNFFGFKTFRFYSGGLNILFNERYVSKVAAFETVELFEPINHVY